MYNPELLDVFLKPYYRFGQPRKERIDGHYYRARVVGARMSGEMWTSLANGFSNLMNFFFLCSEKGLDYLNDVDGIVEGDDGLFGLPREAFTVDDYARLGFKIKMEYRYDIGDTSFCSNVFSPHNLKQMISPEQIVRVNWTCLPCYQHAGYTTQLRLLRSKALSLYCTGKNTPIAQALALKLIELTSGVEAQAEVQHDWWEEWLLRDMPKDFVEVEIDLQSRCHWGKAFGVSVEMQYHLEAKIRSARSLEQIDFDYRFFPFCNLTLSSERTIRA